MGKKINGLCLAGFLVSLISLLINLWGIVGITGTVLSAVGLNSLNEEKETGQGFAIAGMIIGVVSVAYAIVLIVSMMS